MSSKPGTVIPMPACFGVKKSVRFQYAWIVFVTLLLTSIVACKHGISVRYQDGLKATDTYIYYPRRSTSYTQRGKIVYTDSVTGHRVKVEKYRTKHGCWEYSPKRRIVITYDSAGRRISRENLRRLKKCDTCRGYRRQVRAHL